MSDHPTPETDSRIKTFTSVSNLNKSFENRTGTVGAGFARRLERERDEAREQVKELIYIAGRAIELAEIDYENDKFGVVSELRGDLEKIKADAK